MIIVMADDEKYYVQVQEELNDNKVAKFLWTKSLMLANNDKEKAKVKYIQLRVAHLQKADKAKTINKILPAVLVLAVAILFLFLFSNL